SMPYTDRLDYFCSMTNNWAYALSVEKLASIEVPERAEYLRVILAELTRLQNHASLLGFLLSDMGAWGTPLMYALDRKSTRLTPVTPCYLVCRLLLEKKKIDHVEYCVSLLSDQGRQCTEEFDGL